MAWRLRDPISGRSLRLQRVWRAVVALGLAVLVVVANGVAAKAHAEGIDVRSAGCIGPCSDGACCSGWIKLDPNGVGFARNFVCVDYMKNKANATERAWICKQLRKKDDVCPEVANFCMDNAPSSRPCTEEQKNRGMVTTESGCIEKNERCETLRDHPERYDFEKLKNSLMQRSETFRKGYKNQLSRVPNMVINGQIDFDLREEAGGGTTTGSCGDSQRTIIINPVTICKKSTPESPRDVVMVYIHEFGHIVTCLGPTPPEGPARDRRTKEEEDAANEFGRKVESEIYTEPGPGRD